MWSYLLWSFVIGQTHRLGLDLGLQRKDALTLRATKRKTNDNHSTKSREKKKKQNAGRTLTEHNRPLRRRNFDVRTYRLGFADFLLLGCLAVGIHPIRVLSELVLKELWRRFSQERGGGGRGCTHVMHGRSRRNITIDPSIPTMPGRSTSGFHAPGRQFTPSSKRREVIGESNKG